MCLLPHQGVSLLGFQSIKYTRTWDMDISYSQISHPGGSESGPPSTIPCNIWIMWGLTLEQCLLSFLREPEQGNKLALESWFRKTIVWIGTDEWEVADVDLGTEESVCFRKLSSPFLEWPKKLVKLKSWIFPQAFRLFWNWPMTWANLRATVNIEKPWTAD